jgi:four helix bundle protein
MSDFRNLHVLAAAEAVASDILSLLDQRPRRLLMRGQLQGSAGGIPANIREAFGRATVADRNRMLAIARGEAEETISHLRLNVAAKRIAIADFWRLRNRLVAIVKMLNSLMRSG